MLTKMRRIWLGEKGQSMTEFALVVLFVVGIFYLFRESSLLPQVKNAYESVGSYLGSTPSHDKVIQNYSTISKTDLMQVSNEQRIAMDRATLENLASAFLGKSQQKVKAMLMSSPKFEPYNPKAALNQGNLLFDYYIISTGDGENSTVRTKFDNGLVSKDNLLNWMQGNYTDYPSNKKTLESDNRYFFSNDLIDPSGVLNGTAHQAGEYAVSVRCTFDYDAAGNVNSVRIWATRNKKDDYSNNWIRNETDGLVGIVVSK